MIGLSIAFFITTPDMSDMTSQMKRKRSQTFLADITIGISHMPASVHIYNEQINKEDIVIYVNSVSFTTVYILT